MDNRNYRLPDAPGAFTDAILRGGRNIGRYERRRKAIAGGLAAAACIALLTFVGVSLLRRSPAEDNVTFAPPEATLFSVWTHPDDRCFHENPECPACVEGAVELNTETAIEFGKEACAECIGAEG